MRDLGLCSIILHCGDYRAADWPVVLAAPERIGAAERAHESDDIVICRLRESPPAARLETDTNGIP